MPVVHAIAARLRTDVTPEVLERASRAALELEAAPGSDAVRVGRSPSHLVAAVWLPDTAALEPFAASAPHMNFVMRGLAPAVAGMWSVSIATDREPPTADAASIWTFAVPEADGIFEWQIRRQLDQIRQYAGEAWLGPTVEERERYRAGGVVLVDATAAESFDSGMTAVLEAELHLESALAPALDEAALS